MSLPLMPELARLLQERPDWFDRVPADADSARMILDRVSAEELLAVMLQSWQARRSGVDSLHRTAHTLAYDAARKSVDAVLLATGVRTSRAGGHQATVLAAEVVLPPPPDSRRRNVLAFRQARFVRHDDEYPRPRTAGTVTLRERRSQTQNCVRLVQDCRGLLGLAVTDDLVPTDARLDGWTPPSG